MIGQLSPEVRARGVVACSVSARLTTDVGQVDLLGGHAVLDDGRLVVHVADHGAVARAVASASEVRARLLMVDIAPVAMRGRERARLVVVGTLVLAGPEDAAAAWHQLDPHAVDGPVGAVALELVPAVIVLTDDAGQHAIDVDAFVAAEPDPLVGSEAALLQHLAHAHPTSVQLLARAAGHSVGGGAAIVPLRLTARDITLRVHDEDGHHDLVIAFARPVDDPARADRAIAELIGLQEGRRR
jgi:hypothetical protein